MWAMEEMELTTGGPDTHDGNMKREPRAPSQDPSLCKKNILETNKTLYISDYYKCAYLHINTFVRNIFLIITMQQVLRWKYGSTTLGH